MFWINFWLHELGEVLNVENDRSKKFLSSLSIPKVWAFKVNIYFTQYTVGPILKAYKKTCFHFLNKTTLSQG